MPKLVCGLVFLSGDISGYDVCQEGVIDSEIRFFGSIIVQRVRRISENDAVHLIEIKIGRRNHGQVKGREVLPVHPRMNQTCRFATPVYFLAAEEQPYVKK